MTNNAANIRPTDSCNINIAGIGSTINFATILTNNTAKVLGVLTFSVKHYTVKSIGNSAAIFVFTGYTTNIFITGYRTSVNKVVIFFISCNCTAVAACNAANILLAFDSCRTIVNKISKCCTLCIAANHTANIVSTGNSAVVAPVGNTAGVSSQQAANGIAGAGYTGCVYNVFNSAAVPFITIICTFISADDTADIILAADDTFVIPTVHIAIIYANDAANIAAIGCTAVGNAKAINILYIALFCINANYTAKTSTCTTGNICTYCYCAVAEAVGKAAIICANQTTCNSSRTACNNTAGAFNIVNAAAG